MFSYPTHHGQSIAGKMVEYIKEKYKTLSVYRAYARGTQKTPFSTKNMVFGSCRTARRCSLRTTKTKSEIAESRAVPLPGSGKEITMAVSAKEILAEAEALRETMISDRRTLHAAPEAGADRAHPGIPLPAGCAKWATSRRSSQEASLRKSPVQIPGLRPAACGYGCAVRHRADQTCPFARRTAVCTRCTQRCCLVRQSCCAGIRAS